MIAVKNLTKLYKSKKGSPCLALDNVSFTLPEKGMIFILGKSGSGKSTLLNLLGGLDTITDGDIIACGNSFCSFNEQDYSSYRNTFVGFVFQEFCLIDSFSVRENVLLSTDLQNSSAEATLLDIAEKLELRDLLDRMPKELSGGQRQRVAIARALIKNPKLILADEPTGNLDSKSAKQVLDTLKVISKENLVVVVSHNPDDAENYGDRIIEIADGKIISDLTKNQEAQKDIIIVDKEIKLPGNKNFSASEIDLINLNLSDSGYKFTQSDKEFKPTDQCHTPYDKKIATSKSEYSFKNVLKCSMTFLKAKWGSFLFSVLIASAIVILFGLCQLFTSFNGDNTISSAISNSDDHAFIIKKGYVSNEMSNDIETNGLIIIPDEDIQAFYNAGYNGNVYPLVNISFPISKESWAIGGGTMPNVKNLYKNFYSQEILGVLITDEAFLTKIYGQNGKLSYHAVCDTPTDYGFIITDFIADSVLRYNPSYSDYNSILGKTTPMGRGYVNAILDTGYKSRYKDVIDEYFELMKNGTSLNVAEFKTSERYLDFLEELNNYLNIGYTFNSNFLSDTICVQADPSVRYDSGEFSVDSISTKPTFSSAYYASSLDKELADGEIILSLDDYNAVFRTNLLGNELQNFQPGQKVTYSFYPRFHSGESIALYTKEFTIVEIHPNHTIFNDNDADEIHKCSVFRYALYFDNVEQANVVFERSKEMEYTINSPYYNAVVTINDIVAVFKQLFFMIAVILCLAGVIVLLSFGLNSIKKHNFEIGVMRALGAKTIDLGMIFLIQVIFAGAIICVISSVGLYLTSILANDILADSFVVLFESNALKDIQILSFNPIALVVDLAIVIGITLISALAPILAIRKIKPMQIIRAKE